MGAGGRDGFGAPFARSSCVSQRPSSLERAAAGASATTCSAEHTKVDEGGFCVKAPKEWQAKPPIKMGDNTQFIWTRLPKQNFVVWVKSKEKLPVDPVAFVHDEASKKDAKVCVQVAGHSLYSV